MSTDQLERKKQAALTYALGWTRGALSDVLDGDFTREQIQRMFDATAAARIAQSIGLPESAFDADWAEQLSEAEMHRIQGYDHAA